VLFESPRTFRLWWATVSHGQLILRSVKNDAYDTRIDLLFKPVEALKLNVSLQGIVVRESIASEATAARVEVGLPHEQRVLIIESGALTGYVAANAFAFHEDTGEYGEASYRDLPALSPE
jgi:hypothetical protein